MTHMQRISACLWFDGQAEDAAKFYTSILNIPRSDSDPLWRGRSRTEGNRYDRYI
jgi:predicted 3-demethylubiquinone-9 3-methyltransferase (glyoxalase superfamily)